MSSVLHPVGPEEPRTYWVRRMLVIAAAVVAVIVVVVLVVNAAGGSQTVVATPTPLAAPETTAASTPAAAGETATPTTSATGPSAAGKSTSTTPTSTKPTATKPTATQKAKPTPTPIVDCPPDQLRATLNGKQKLKLKKPNTFEVSLINGFGQTCRLKVSSGNFELKIYSGKDRIWSTNDCGKLVKGIDTLLAAEKAVAWKITWNGRRSRAGCKQRPEVPRPGTYFATAQFTGAKPVQLRMILR